MGSETPAHDPALVDRLWVGYHPRAAAPALAVALLASLLVWTGRWYLDDLSELADRIGALTVFALGWCVWPALGTVYLYRTITYTYRLTDRAILVDFGFWHRPVPPLWLNQLSSVTVGGGWLGRLLGVGWVELTGPGRVVRLTGVRNPHELARQIRPRPAPPAEPIH